MTKAVSLQILLFCVVATIASWGQSGKAFQTLSKKDGLSQASVFAIAQDSSGFLWFGTRDGLNKYDGYQFTSYNPTTNDNSLVGTGVRALYYDEPHNYLWIGSTSGLSHYDLSLEKFSNYSHDPTDKNSLSNNEVKYIHRDRKHRLWIGTSVGINLLNEETGAFERYYIDNSKPLGNLKNDVQAIHEDKDGTLWLGTGAGLHKLVVDRNGSFIFQKQELPEQQGLTGTNIKSILEDKKGNFWLGTFELGLFYWDRANNLVTHYSYDKNDPSSLSHNSIRSLCLDEEDNLWVATFDGLNYLKNGSSQFERFMKSAVGGTGLSDKSIHSLLIDNTGSLWVGTYYGGVNHLDENYNRFKNNIPTGNGLRGKVVSSFAEDSKGNLWIGTEGDGLNYLDQSRKSIRNYKHDPQITNTISGNNVKQLLLDGNQLWIGTFQAGLNVLDIPTGNIKHYKHLPSDKNSISSNNVYGQIKDNNLLYIITYGGGLDVLNIEQEQFYNFGHQPDVETSLSSNYGRTIKKAKSNHLWIGTENGLNKVALDSANMPVSSQVYLQNENIYSLTMDSDDFLWVGTFGNGLYRLDSEKNILQHYTTKDGLPGNTVLGILEVAKDEYWLSTNNGLSRFTPQSRQFTNYGYSNGLENSEYNYNAYLKDSNGNLLFGGLNGFTYFNPDNINPSDNIPPLVFTELRKNNQIIKVGDDSGLLTRSINETEEITFKYLEANFSIKFAALDYFNPENNLYSYMLVGIDQDWNTSIGKNEATYAIQRHGEYTFKLKGGNSEGLWNPVDRQIKITVLPPPWRTWWAYMGYFLLLLAFILGLYRFVKLRHTLQLEKLVNQQQAELHEVKLRFFTNITHEFRTPLTLIIAPLTELLAKSDMSHDIKNKLDTVDRNAKRMLNLVNQILTFRKLATDHTDLQISRVNLVELLQQVFLLFKEAAIQKGIHYEFDIISDSTVAWIDREKMEKVFFNLLSNAFKFTPNGENIVVSIRQKTGYIEIRVSDSGLGIEEVQRDQIFKRFYEKSNATESTIKGSGIGLAISKQMVELHKGEIYLAEPPQATFEKGATFVVHIQKGRKHLSDHMAVHKSPIAITAPSDEPLSSLAEEVAVVADVVEEPTSYNDAPSIHPRETILVIDDNAEVRKYIVSIFDKSYHILTAKNGEEGLQKALGSIPDLIISDVMMPVKDGMALASDLKSRIETSTIPIVLLTAKAATYFKVEGLKTGADDYVTKPFHPEELKLRVKNLLDSRRKAKFKIKRLSNLEPVQVDVSSADELFMERALSAVEKHIDQYEFNISQFALELAVSRPQLFAKLKSLTELTPNNFIKSVRMKRAAQLLTTTTLNISEIAYKVGFKDVKYFSRCFKAQYGVPPSKYNTEDIET